MIPDPSARSAYEARLNRRLGMQADAFEKGLPSTRVTRLADGSRFIFMSNEAEVLREMETFLSGVP